MFGLLRQRTADDAIRYCDDCARVSTPHARSVALRERTRTAALRYGVPR